MRAAFDGRAASKSRGKSSLQIVICKLGIRYKER
jgi:hypothetical protein